MKAAGAILAVAVALAIQTTLARFLVRGSVAVDLVLVAVVYVSLTSGPVTGMLTGTFAGLIQDALSGGVIGIGGLAKTIVGFLAGIIGTQFIVAQPLPRFVVFLAPPSCMRPYSWDYTYCSKCGSLAHRMPLPSGRRSATPSSAWLRFSWSSCCPAPWSGAGPAVRAFVGELWR